MTVVAAGRPSRDALRAGATGASANGADPVGAAAHATGSAGGRVAEGASYAGALVHGTDSVSVRAGGAGDSSAAALLPGSAGLRG